MADVVTVDNGGLSDYAVATDDITITGGPAGHVQYFKLVDGTPDGTVPITGDERGLWVVPHLDLQRIEVTSAGLTTSSTAYTAGDQCGTQFTFANAARITGGSGLVRAVYLTSAADITGPFDLMLSDSSITLAADNAAYAISDADALKTLPPVQLAGSLDIGNNRIAFATNLTVAFTCVGGTSLYGGLITRTGHTFFGAVGDIAVSLFVERN